MIIIQITRTRRSLPRTDDVKLCPRPAAGSDISRLCVQAEAHRDGQGDRETDPRDRRPDERNSNRDRTRVNALVLGSRSFQGPGTSTSYTWDGRWLHHGLIGTQNADGRQEQMSEGGHTLPLDKNRANSWHQTTLMVHPMMAIPVERHNPSIRFLGRQNDGWS